MMRAALRKLRSDREGAAVVELALVAPLLASVVIGMTDLANAYSRKLALEQGAQRAIERQMQTTGDDTPEDIIKEEAALQADVEEDQVTVEYIRLCNGVEQTDFSADCPSGQATADYLSVTLTDDYDPIFPALFGEVQANGTYRVTATAGMRTQ
jgi:Flp pilus assembly pilin Flp